VEKLEIYSLGISPEIAAILHNVKGADTIQREPTCLHDSTASLNLQTDVFPIVYLSGPSGTRNAGLLAKFYADSHAWMLNIGEMILYEEGKISVSLGWHFNDFHYCPIWYRDLRIKQGFKGFIPAPGRRY
jgi:hypothetical protein